MKYYKDLAGNLHVLDDAAFEHLLPAGSVEITDDEAAELERSKLPAWSPDPLLKIARAGREIALNRLAGIAFAAQHSGDSSTVDVCLAARQALLDITKLPGVLAATDDASLKAAMTAGYASIVMAAPETVRSAFADIQT